ncbi:MAG: hypothetical protein AB7T17_05865 [Geobacter sp.]
MQTFLIGLVGLLLSCCLTGGAWAAEVVEVPLNATASVTTGAHPAGLPSFFGPSDYSYAIFRFTGLTPGQRYEATISYESGTDIGYGHSWVDGTPFGTDYRSFTGIGTGTGSGPRRESQQKFLFTIDPASSCGELYLVLKSSRPMALRVSLQRPSGVTKDSQDRYGYYYVTDFDLDRSAPFLLKRCTANAGTPSSSLSSGFVEVPVNGNASVTTGLRPAGLPNFFGPGDYFYTLFKLVGLVPGQRYEVTFSFDFGANIGYGHSWGDGSPLSSSYRHFTGIGTGTGSGPRREDQKKFLFTVDPHSSSNALYIVFSSNRPMALRASLQRPSGVSKDSQDRYGYYYVTDFDADRTSPFLLQR